MIQNDYMKNIFEQTFLIVTIWCWFCELKVKIIMLFGKVKDTLK